MRQKVSLEQLVDGIYEAALSPSTWPSTLEGIASMVSGVGVDFYLFDKDRIVFSSIGGIPDEALHEYLLVYHGKTDRSLALARAQEGEVFSDLDFLSMDSMDREEFYRDFLRRWGVRLFIGGCPLKSPEQMCMFGVHFAPERRTLDQREYRLVSAVVPHLRRASLIQLRLERAEASERRLHDALHAIAQPIILVRRNGAVVSVNAAAEALLAGGDPLTQRCGILRATRESDNRALESAIIAAAEGLSSTQQIELMGLSLQSPVAVIACSLSRQRRLEEGADVLIVLRRAGGIQPDLSDRIRQAYGLTVTEAQLAAWLAGGGTLRSWSSSRNTTYDTARSQLRSLFSKTGATRQADLVRRLLTM